uniref:Uncharacterized protein n=1 Tax=Octopus bimaculoides TaxID=37653 RepID=A0A0L8GPF4_OCTBM
MFCQRILQYTHSSLYLVFNFSLVLKSIPDLDKRKEKKKQNKTAYRDTFPHMYE